MALPAFQGGYNPDFAATLPTAGTDPEAGEAVSTPQPSAIPTSRVNPDHPIPRNIGLTFEIKHYSAGRFLPQRSEGWDVSQRGGMSCHVAISLRLPEQQLTQPLNPPNDAARDNVTNDLRGGKSFERRVMTRRCKTRFARTISVCRMPSRLRFRVSDVQ